MTNDAELRKKSLEGRLDGLRPNSKLYFLDRVLDLENKEGRSASKADIVPNYVKRLRNQGLTHASEREVRNGANSYLSKLVWGADIGSRMGKRNGIAPQEMRDDLALHENVMLDLGTFRKGLGVKKDLKRAIESYPTTRDLERMDFPIVPLKLIAGGIEYAQEVYNEEGVSSSLPVRSFEDEAMQGAEAYSRMLEQLRTGQSDLFYE